MADADIERHGLEALERELGPQMIVAPIDNAIGEALVLLAAPVVAVLIYTAAMASIVNGATLSGSGVLALPWFGVLSAVGGGLSGGLVILARRLLARQFAGFLRGAVSALLGTTIGMTLGVGILFFGYGVDKAPLVAAVAIIPLAVVLALLLQLGKLIHRLSSLHSWRMTQQRQSSPASD
jgi:hypothetical protein